MLPLCSDSISSEKHFLGQPPHPRCSANIAKPNGGQGGFNAAEARSSALGLGDLRAVRKRILSESPQAANIPHRRLKGDKRLLLYG